MHDPDAIDTIDRLDISTIVVVAPRILLAEQLCSEFLVKHIDIEDVEILHVHSGETTHLRTTKVDAIDEISITSNCGRTIVLL